MIDTGAIAVDPKDPTGETIYVGTGAPNRSGDDLYGSGILKSTDGGNTFQLIATGSVDNPEAFFREAFAKIIGVWRSSTDGMSWDPPRNVGFARAGDVNRVALAADHRSGRQTVYAAVANFSQTGRTLESVYFTTNNADTWEDLRPQDSVPDIGGYQADFDLAIGLSPNTGRVYVAGQTKIAEYFVDLGRRWVDISRDPNNVAPHVDFHAITFDASGKVYVGSDGGLWRYTPQQAGIGTWDDLNANELQTHQLYGIAQSDRQSDRGIFLEGSQDNGIARTIDGGRTWTRVLDGDGGMVAFDQGKAYATWGGVPDPDLFQGSNDLGQTWQSRTPTDPTRWPYPLVLAQWPRNTSYLMLGSKSSVWETRSGGTGGNPWLQIGPRLDATGVTALAYSTNWLGPYSVFAGFTDGQIFRMDYPNNDWTPQPWSTLPHPWGNRRVTGIAAEPVASGVVYVTVAGFSTGGGPGQVFRSNNYGQSWQDITGDLPNVPANAVVVDVADVGQYVPYVGNDDGVYYGLPTGTAGYTWTRLESGLPHVQVRNLQIQTYGNTRILAAATHGRGAWTVQLGGVAPAITCVCALSGPVGGGVRVRINGEGFLGTSRVSFGAVPATQFTLYSDNEIVATVPAAQVAGTVDVTVTNPSGTSTTSSLDQFTYVTTPIRTLSQYNPACLLPNADATDPVDLGFMINFFGQSYSGVYVSNDGYVSFGRVFGDETPYHLSDVQVPIIAPFWADVDTGVASVVSYGRGILDNGDLAFAVNWINVGYDLGHDDLTNSFQLVLIARPDVGVGAFDIEFNYSQLRWEAGDSSGGSGGLGGISAYAGYSDGTGIPGNSFELYGSGINGYFLDSSGTGLVHHDYSGTRGRYVYNIPGGSSPPAPLDSRTRSPAVRGVKPGRGATRGGTEGYLVGTDLPGATAVFFGDARATSFRVVSPGRIVFRTPPHPAGVVDVRGITPDGITPVAPAERFTYAAGSGPVEEERPKDGRGGQLLGTWTRSISRPGISAPLWPKPLPGAFTKAECRSVLARRASFPGGKLRCPRGRRDLVRPRLQRRRPRPTRRRWISSTPGFWRLSRFGRLTCSIRRPCGDTRPDRVLCHSLWRSYSRRAARRGPCPPAMKPTWTPSGMRSQKPARATR